MQYLYTHVYMYEVMTGDVEAEQGLEEEALEKAEEEGT